MRASLALSAILSPPGSARLARKYIERRAAIITPQHHLELPNWESVKLAVARGHGVAGCSHFTVAAELRAGTLCVIQLPGWKVRRMIDGVGRHHGGLADPVAATTPDRA